MTIEIQTHRNMSVSDPAGKICVSAIFEDYPNLLGEALIHAVVDKIAERFVEENYAQLVSKLDQQAVANLAVATAGKKIAEEIRTRPVVVREKPVVIREKWSLF